MAFEVTVKQKQVLPLLDRAGMPYTPKTSRSNEDVPAWDGKALLLGNLGAADLVHELGHFLVAPQKVRWKENYGLGSDFTGAGLAKPVVPLRMRNIHEGQASLLGILIEKELGWDWWCNFHAHGWTDSEERVWENFCRTVGGLFRKGLIDDGLRPLICKGAPK